MLDPRIVLVDLSEDCGLVVDYVRPRITTGILTSSAKDNSVPGRMQTATFASSDAEKPLVPVSE